MTINNSESLVSSPESLVSSPESLVSSPESRVSGLAKASTSAVSPASKPETRDPKPETNSPDISKLTPLMRQYHEIKARYPDEILFFRLGDFFELFGDDARRAAPILEVALTHRQTTPMCGVPAHAIDPYIAKVLKAGLRVAMADQLEEPSVGKGLVRRDVVRLITAGTLQEDSLLSAKRSNFLVALAIDGNSAGLAAIECSTGEFVATQHRNQGTAIWDEVMRLSPSEVVLSTQTGSEAWRTRLTRQGIAIASLPPTDFSEAIAQERLKKLFGTASLRGFGLEDKPLALSAAGAALRYLEGTQCGRPFALRPLKTYSLDDFLLMDASTLRHLDLVDSSAGKAGRSLLSILDQTQTPMGARLLRQWLLSPLKNVEQIHERHSVIDFFLEARESRRHLREILQGWPDMERILTRVRSQSGSPRDLASLANGLKRVLSLKNYLSEAHAQATLLGATLSPKLVSLLTQFPEEPELADRLSSAIVESPPAQLSDGGVIRDGYTKELDEVRSWIRDGKTLVLELEKGEKERTGIGNLKVGFNNVFGYFIEITRSHISRVPTHYIRKQTTTNSERYITPELKEFETKILGAEERALRLEATIVKELCARILERSTPLQILAQALAELDVFLGLAEVAERQHYVKPVIDQSSVLQIQEGRHPVLDEVLSPGTLVSNDLFLDGKERQILILTGPNMSGKSTYLRQTALIVIMAQIGSFVPAAHARIGVIDQVFTRIGASDRLADGESTFMVEMVETAHILNHATERSLVILDEVGRGTSTYDGISIAWACLEFLNGESETRGVGGSEKQLSTKPSTPALRPPDPSPRGPKVLFATHYFELTQLSERLYGVQNAHVSAREWGDQVIFLHKVEDGPADRAYGIHVARLAGVPGSVIERAQKLLQRLESRETGERKPNSSRQPLLFDLEGVETMVVPQSKPAQTPSKAEQLQKRLEDLTINAMTPLQALTTLHEWKTQLTDSTEGA